MIAGRPFVVQSYPKAVKIEICFINLSKKKYTLIYIINSFLNR